jgi:hypothetical protein
VIHQITVEVSSGTLRSPSRLRPVDQVLVYFNNEIINLFQVGFISAFVKLGGVSAISTLAWPCKNPGSI